MVTYRSDGTVDGWERDRRDRKRSFVRSMLADLDEIDDSTIGRLHDVLTAAGERPRRDTRRLPKAVT